jgi:hypothetical protein
MVSPKELARRNTKTSPPRVDTGAATWALPKGLAVTVMGARVVSLGWAWLLVVNKTPKVKMNLENMENLSTKNAKTPLHKAWSAPNEIGEI